MTSGNRQQDNRARQPSDQTDCLIAGRPYLSLMTVHFPFEHSYAAMPANFFARVAPTPVAAPRLIKLNRPLAIQLGLDPDLLATPEGAEILAGKRLPEGADPIAMAYAGHQFGHFVPQLGDGRAILLGEVIDADGVRRIPPKLFGHGDRLSVTPCTIPSQNRIRHRHLRHATHGPTRATPSRGTGK